MASRAVSVPSITLIGSAVSVRRRSRGFRPRDPCLRKAEEEYGPAKDGVLRVEMGLLGVCTQ